MAAIITYDHAYIYIFKKQLPSCSSAYVLGQTSPASNHTWLWTNPHCHQAGDIQPSSQSEQETGSADRHPSYSSCTATHDQNISNKTPCFCGSNTKLLSSDSCCPQTATKPQQPMGKQHTGWNRHLRGHVFVRQLDETKISCSLLPENRDQLYQLKIRTKNRNDHISSQLHSCSCAVSLKSHEASKKNPLRPHVSWYTE